MTPFHQGPGVSLSDAICWILLEFRKQEKAGNMPEIIERITKDYPGVLAHQHVSATIHKALGALIKERKVYYTGAGYFLVIPDRKQSAVEKMRWPQSCCTNWTIQMRQDSSCQTEVETESCIVKANCLPRANRKLWTKPKNVEACDLDPLSCYNVSDEEDTSEDVPKIDLLPDSRRSHNEPLKRSQSLRLSKEAKMKLEVGGSLKLSKTESVKLQQYFESENN